MVPVSYGPGTILQKGPAFLIRNGNVNDKLIPETITVPRGDGNLTFTEEASKNKDDSERNPAQARTGLLAP